MKLFKLLLLSIVCAGFASCDNLEFDDRFDGPIVNGEGKNVLVEDYTGQKCSNCPLAHEEIENLQHTYGKNRVIAVAIHGGPQAVDAGNGKITGLANDESKEYNRRLGAFSYPKGIVDRISGLQDFEKWASYVVARFSIAPKVQLAIRDISVNEKENQLSFQCEVESTENLNGQLQLWLTESDIRAVQTLPSVWGGGHQEDYVHNHVFRATVNGMDGEAMALTAGAKRTKAYSFHLNADWKPQNMALVAFFYNDTDGVVQVIDAPLFQPTEN